MLDASRNPTKPGTFSRLKSDRPWRQVAGIAATSPAQFIRADNPPRRPVLMAISQELLIAM
jgi:hypothetical protein